MDDQNKNLILAMVLSSAVLIIWMILFAPDPNDLRSMRMVRRPPPKALPLPNAVASDGTATTAAPQETAETTPEAPRLTIETPSYSGSLSLAGGRIDELALSDYDVELTEESPEVTLFSPAGSDDPYYAHFGWLPGGDLQSADVPSADTLWTVASGTKLTPETPVTLTWESPTGLTFNRQISVDDRFMFTVTQTVENTTGNSILMALTALSHDKVSQRTSLGFSSFTKGPSDVTTVSFMTKTTANCQTLRPTKTGAMAALM